MSDDLEGAKGMHDALMRQWEYLQRTTSRDVYGAVPERPMTPEKAHMPQDDAESALSPRNDGSTGGATGETENALGVDLEAILKRHKQSFDICRDDLHAWPCDTVRLLAHIDRLERENAEREARLYLLERDVAERRHLPSCPAVARGDALGDCQCHLAAVQGIQLKATAAERDALAARVGELEGALREIVNALGPEKAGCRSSPHCEGCLTEAEIALDTARAALARRSEGREAREA